MNAIRGWRNNLKVLRKLTIEAHISTIHTWCTPAGAIGWLLARKTGLPLVLDSYEPHAESMVENGTWSRNGIAFRILFYLEKKQTESATWHISVADGMQAYAKNKYNFAGKKFFVKPACIDLSQFDIKLRKDPVLLKELHLQSKIVCVYAGKFGGIYQTHEAFTFFKMAAEQFGDAFRVLLLTSEKRESIDEMATQAKLNKEIIISRFVPHSEMPKYLGLGDFAYSAIKPVPTKRYCTPIKNGEYWAMGLPVVIPDGISNDSAIIQENNAGYVLKSSDVSELKKAVHSIDQLLRNEAVEELSTRIRNLAEKHRNFNTARAVYSAIYQSNE
jgi:glycosyltransferase involved in cell wall biosynthesis